MRCSSKVLVFATIVAGGFAKQGTNEGTRDTNKISRYRHVNTKGQTRENQITEVGIAYRDGFKSKSDRFNLEKVSNAENKFWTKIMTEISSLQTSKPTHDPTPETKKCKVDVSKKNALINYKPNCTLRFLTHILRSGRY